MDSRLFLAIRPPPGVRGALLAAMGGPVPVRWQDDAQLHLTLRFLGDVDRHRAGDLVASLDRLDFTPFTIALRGAGLFDRRRRAHSLWVGVAHNPALDALQRRIERACIACGLPADPRVFHPHVTLARMNVPVEALASTCAALDGQAFGSWPCSEFVLYRSHLRREGSHYEALRRFPAVRSR